MLFSTLSSLLPPPLPPGPIATDEPSEVLDEAPEKSAKEKRKRKKEKERDGLATTAARAPAAGTSQPVTGDKRQETTYKESVYIQSQ